MDFNQLGNMPDLVMHPSLSDTERMKNIYSSRDLQKNIKISFVLATEALGMSLNAPHIRRVIHYKPPTSIKRGIFRKLEELGEMVCIVRQYCTKT